ncbi:MAG: class I SAM-dependent methyltransferase [Gemmataceae bacterium]
MTPAPNFDRLAPLYAGLEWITFGRLLQSCRVAMLPHVRDCRKVLIVGDGDGRFLAALLDALPEALPEVTVDSVDISAGMIELARKRIGGKEANQKRVRFTVADIRHDPIPGQDYDLIVTNFLLDCFPAQELELVIDRLNQVALPDAKWIVGDFALPQTPWKRWLSRLVLAGMYVFFRIVTRLPARSLVDPSPLLKARGWVPRSETAWLSGFLVSRLWTHGTPSC